MTKIAPQLLYLAQGQVLSLRRRAVIFVVVIEAQEREVVLRRVAAVSVKVRDLPGFKSGVTVVTEADAAPAPRLEEHGCLS